MASARDPEIRKFKISHVRLHFIFVALVLVAQLLRALQILRLVV